MRLPKFPPKSARASPPSSEAFASPFSLALSLSVAQAVRPPCAVPAGAQRQFVLPCGRKQRECVVRRALRARPLRGRTTAPRYERWWGVYHLT